MRYLMTMLVSILLALSMVGCGSNPCEDACDKLKECGMEGTQGIDCSGECPSEYEPMMECIAGLTCEQLKDAQQLMACLTKK
jgi:hypothetical protein